MGAAWRSPKDRDIEAVEEMVKAVKALGLETCATLGMLKEEQAQRLASAGLDYYNHNLDTAPEFYGEIITTRDYQDRLDTLGHVREAGLKVCCGGIVGMGESRLQRAGLIAQLANLNPYPDSVPINHLVAVEGTPLADQEPLDPLEFVRYLLVWVYIASRFNSAKFSVHTRFRNGLGTVFSPIRSRSDSPVAASRGGSVSARAFGQARSCRASPPVASESGYASAVSRSLSTAPNGLRVSDRLYLHHALSVRQPLRYYQGLRRSSGRWSCSATGHWQTHRSRADTAVSPDD
jgi:hypothetical protein